MHSKDCATGSSTTDDWGDIAMAYDFEPMNVSNVDRQQSDPDSSLGFGLQNYRPHSQDLEAIVTLLEVAALSLTTEPEATFTIEDLVDEARDLGGEEVPIQERDLKIVLGKATFLKKVGRAYRLR